MNKSELLNVDPNKLFNYCKDILISLGISENGAKITAEVLIDANLKGIDSHGITRLPVYSKRLKLGVSNNNPVINFAQMKDSTSILDGDNGLGQIIAYKATEKAIDLADNYGTGFVGVKNSNHFGIAGFYVNKILESNKIGFVFSNSASTMVPFGGKDKFFGTNPLAIGIPTGSDFPIVIDMATSVVARGNIILASKENRKIPEGWAIDKNGNMTTDPNEALQGAVLPFSGPKGSALALMVDVLSGVLSNGAWSNHVNSQNTNFEEPQAVGHFIGAIDITGFMPVNQFKEKMNTYIKEMKSISPAPDFNEIKLPGEIEFETKKRRLKEGIPLSKEIRDELTDLGNQFKIDFNDYIK
ncbi:MAG: Ldh family oxidoreductase [Bacillota bacterium]